MALEPSSGTVVVCHREEASFDIVHGIEMYDITPDPAALLGMVLRFEMGVTTCIGKRETISGKILIRNTNCLVQQKTKPTHPHMLCGVSVSLS